MFPRIMETCEDTEQKEDPKVSQPAEMKKPEGGWGWVVIFSSFTINFLTDGVVLTFGLFFDDLVEHFHGSISKTLSLNSIMVGTYFLMGPIAGALTKRFGCRNVAMSGSFISGVGLFSSTFSPSLDVMILFYAGIGGIGFGLVVLPAQVAITRYFHRRLSFANGLSRCGSGVGGFVFAPLSVYLSETYGWQGAILMLSGLCLNGIPLAALYGSMKVEEDDKESVCSYEKESVCSSIKSMFDFSLLVSPAMWIYGFIIFLVFFGYLIPFNFIPSYAEDLGLSPNQAAFLISVISICNTVMRVLLGLLGDRPWADSIIIHSLLLVIGGTVTCFVPYFREFGVLTTYCVVYGSALAAVVSLKPAILVKVLGSHKLSDMYGIVNAWQGVAIFLGSPVTGLLVDTTGQYNIAFYVSGAMICVGGMLGIPLRILEKLERRKTSKKDIKVFHIHGT